MKNPHSVITPSFLKQLHQARIPWAQHHVVTGKELMFVYCSECSGFVEAIKAAWPALEALSEFYGPDGIPDMMSFLPSPHDTDFPEQASGMLVLLDQAPRMLFQDIDVRWMSWFDQVARTLYAKIYGLHRDLWPWGRARWADASFEYWFCVAMQFNAPLAHQESVKCQKVSEGHVERLRRAVERHTGYQDPRRVAGTLGADEFTLVDITGDIDLDYEWPFHEAAFFLLYVDNAHKAIIDRFGRYPYRNAIKGRLSTGKELEWIERTEHVAEATPDVAKRVNKDMEAGRWTPLGERTDAAEPGDVVIDVIAVPGEDISRVETSLTITVRLGDPGWEIYEWLPEPT